jgi:D-glycero-D-manno-heptose 1,7-bisphosphate phosphatase
VLFQAWANREPSAGDRVILLDRDGVLIDFEDRYAVSKSQIRLIIGAKRAVALLSRLGFRLVIVSNQSGISKGYVSERAALDINAEVMRRLDPFKKIIEFTLMCPHSDLDKCDCRKPAIGGINNYRDQIGDLTDGWFVGDKLSDLRCGEALEMTSALVLTGHGRETAQEMASRGERALMYESVGHFAAQLR